MTADGKTIAHRGECWRPRSVKAPASSRELGVTMKSSVDVENDANMPVEMLGSMGQKPESLRRSRSSL
jgi:hypothetical protein